MADLGDADLASQLAATMCADLDSDREEPCFRCVEKADAIASHPDVDVTTLSRPSADYHGDMLAFGKRVEARMAIMLPGSTPTATDRGLDR